MAIYKEQIRNLLLTRPGLTEKELTQAIFGPDNLFEQGIKRPLSTLQAQGILRKEGVGGIRDPYRYYLTEAGSSCAPE